MTELKDIGEFGFINRFAHKFDRFIKEEELGIGDDCAVIPINDTFNYVVSTDLLNEDIHFLRDKITAKELGYKSLAVNLSDLAAMGAEPKFSFLSFGIPKDLPLAYLDDFMSAYYALSEQYQIPLMGGDTTQASDKLTINVTVIGKCKKTEMHLRSMAKDGDVICVTGSLGDSAAGLSVILQNLEQNEENNYLKQKHHAPKARIEEGMWLAKRQGVHAMMDVSDGIASDLMHIVNASNCAANIFTDKLPLSTSLQKAAKHYRWDVIEMASSGGEDYELLFTVAAEEYDTLKQAYALQFGEELSLIGEIKKGDSAICWLNDGVKIENNKEGFNHFSKRSE